MSNRVLQTADQMHRGIALAVRQLYEALEAPKPQDIEGCPCCISIEQISVLLSTPLHEITLEQMRPYARNVTSTVGNEVDFRYFWPRMAELLVTAPSFGQFEEPELVLHRLRLADWFNWPEGERHATTQYLASLIERLADEPLFPSEVNAWVCGVSQAIDDVTPLLDGALLHETPVSAHNLYGLYESSRRKIEKRATLDGWFWDLQGTNSDGSFVNPNVALIVAWFRTPRVSEAVDRAYAAEAVAERPLGT